MDLIIGHLPLPNYEQAYYLASIAGIVTVFFSVWRSKEPFWPYLFLVLMGFAFYLLGINLAAISLEGWQTFLGTGELPGHQGRNEVGGIILLPLGVMIGQRLLACRGPVLDHFALAIPVAALFYRQGCLHSGCCFGLPTKSPLGLSFHPETLVFKHQVAMGHIPEFGLASLPVHPAPLYFLVVALITWLLGIFFWNRFPLGKRYFALMAIFLFGRFLVDFFLDPAANSMLGFHLGPLKAGQWGLIFLVVGYTGIGLVSNSKPIEKVVTIPEMWRQFAVLGLIYGLFLLFRNHFPSLEALAFTLLLAATFVAVLLGLSLARSRNGRSWTFSKLLIVAMLCMGQTTAFKQKDHDVRFGVDLLPGELALRQKIGDDFSGGCGSTPVFRPVELQGTVSASLSSQFRFPSRRRNIFNGVGLGLNFSQFSLREPVSGDRENLSSVMAYTFYSFDGRSAGFRLGMQVGFGDFLYEKDMITNRDLPTWGNELGLLSNKNFGPLFSLRLGPRDRAFFEAGYGTYPYAFSWQSLFGMMTVKGPLWGWKNQSGFSVGVMRIETGAPVFVIEPQIAIKNKIFLIPVARFGELNSYGFSMRINFKPTSNVPLKKEFQESQD